MRLTRLVETVRKGDALVNSHLETASIGQKFTFQLAYFFGANRDEVSEVCETSRNDGRNGYFADPSLASC